MNEDQNEKVIRFPAGGLNDEQTPGVRTRELNDAEHARIDGYKERLWAKVNELMESGGYTSQSDFDFKMSTWVQGMVIDAPAADRELVMQAGDEIQRRFIAVMLAAMEAEGGES